MGKTFFTSDLHFGHSNIIKYCNRPFNNSIEMANILIENWNKTVNKNDTVYIVGDFGFNNVDSINETIELLNGKKHLIVGNHDHFIKNKKFNKDLFVWIKDYYMLKTQYKGEKLKIVMSHFPFYNWDCKHYGSVHAHGHIHNSNPDLYKIIGNTAYNVGVDENNFTPIELNEMMSIIEKR